VILHRIRRSPALVLTLEGDGVQAFDFLARTRAQLSPLDLDLLSLLPGWRAPAELFIDAGRRAEIATALLGLIERGFIVVEDSPEADLAGRLERDWDWGPIAGHFHFGIKDPGYFGPAAATAFLEQRALATSRVPLVASNEGLPTVTVAPAPASPLVELMHRRRTSRAFDPDRPLPLAALGDCLRAGLGVVGWIATGVAGEGLLPLTTTPSGGARNPYEAYVVARDVDGLAPGTYHYAGIDGTLGLLRPGPPPDLTSLLGNQAWFADAGAVVLLVAFFERSMWKYPHPTGFRVVLIEAGHIAQNLLLAATAHDLAAAPTCAISDAAVEELLGLDRVTQAAIHAVALGARSPRPSPNDPVVIGP
jgi:SagB-type dehydrogenase family enzyme